MSDQTPEARLAAALHETARKNHNLGEGPMRSVCLSAYSHETRASAILAADPTLAADLALAAAVRADNEVEPPNEAIWRDLPQSRHEGFWFTVDSLAEEIAANWLLDAPMYRGDQPRRLAAAIIKAAKEASE